MHTHGKEGEQTVLSVGGGRNKTGPQGRAGSELEADLRNIIPAVGLFT